MAAVTEKDIACAVSRITTARGPTTVVRVRGEIDLVTIGSVRDALDTAVLDRPAYLVIDFVGVTFCGAHGFALVITAVARAAGAGFELAVCGAPRRARRFWPVLWDAAHQPVCHADLAAAVRAPNSAGEAAVEHRVAESA